MSEKKIPWMKSLPNGWRMQYLKRYVALINGYPFNSEDLLYEGIPVIRIGDISSEINFSNVKRFNISHQFEMKKYATKEKDILLAMSGATIGKTSYYTSKQFSIINQRVGILRIKAMEALIPGYLKNLAMSEYFIWSIKVRSYGGAQPNISTDAILNLALPIPPLETQKEIADFLDREVALIDQLIEKKKRLLKLLDLKMRTKISQLYRSIESDQALKYKLKYLIAERLKYGASEEGNTEQTGIRYIRITDLNHDGSLKSNASKTLEKEKAAPYLLKEGDILLARSGATVGKSFIYKAAFGTSCFAGYLIRARIDIKKALPVYIKFFTESQQYWDYIVASNIQSTIENISAEKYGNIKIPLCSIDDQKEATLTLQLQKERHEVVSIKINQSILLLEKLKTSLITEAVTGQLNILKYC